MINLTCDKYSRVEMSLTLTFALMGVYKPFSGGRKTSSRSSTVVVLPFPDQFHLLRVHFC